ncbi:MAG TPA: hypothetical protein VN824_14385, partial [Puia sp.]|nr:hypothetical protein [Puia sp.]
VPYLYQPNWAVRGTTEQYQGSAFYIPLNLFSPDYHWSTTRGYNGQLTLGFFHDWLVIEGDAYLKRSDDQLLGITLPSQAGFTSVQSNAPYTVQNSGWELTISPHPGPLGKNSNRLALSAPSFVFGRNNNKVLNIPPNSPYAAFYRNGQPVSGVMLVKYAGVDPATGLFQYYKADGKTLTFTPSLVSAYQTINPGDANQLANIGTPVFNWGVGEGITWKDLSVNVFLQFVKQKGYNYLYSVYSGGNGPGTPNYNAPALILGKEWKKPGDQALLAGFIEGGHSEFISSTAVVSDASYFRLSNLSVNYRLSGRYIRKAGMKTAAVSINCQNLFTITGYKVGDPSTMSIYNIPPQRVISGGLNLNF